MMPFIKLPMAYTLVTSGNKNHGNGYISNTVFQVTSEPACFAICCNKNNFTCSMIEETGYFAFSILKQETNPDIFKKFGYQSGRDINKLEGAQIQYNKTNVPIITDDSIAWFECKVIGKQDAGTHLIFIGELLDANILDTTLQPITYEYYREIKKGLASKNAPTYIDKTKLNTLSESNAGQYRCSACGNIYDNTKETIKFDGLPADWKCPVCGADKEDFIQL